MLSPGNWFSLIWVCSYNLDIYDIHVHIYTCMNTFQEQKEYPFRKKYLEIIILSSTREILMVARWDFFCKQTRKVSANVIFNLYWKSYSWHFFFLSFQTLGTWSDACVLWQTYWWQWQSVAGRVSKSFCWCFLELITPWYGHFRKSLSGGRLNKKDGLTRYGDSHVKDKTS